MAFKIPHHTRSILPMFDVDHIEVYIKGIFFVIGPIDGILFTFKDECFAVRFF